MTALDFVALDSTYNYLSVGNVLEEFKEVDEVKGIIGNLSSIFNEKIVVEMALERYLYIIDQYQEQPHLLDPHLEAILNQLLELVKNPKTDEVVLHLAFKLMYLITKTRGYKVIVRLLPHEVADLEPVLTLLNKQNPEDVQTWETRYMLMLWLSMVSMIPFDMVRLDSNSTDEAGDKRAPIMDRIIDVGKRYIVVNDKSRDAAAYMLSRFMTRPDVKKEKLPEFVDWSLAMLKEIKLDCMASWMVRTGVLATLALLFKHGKREDMLNYASMVLEMIQSLTMKDNINTTLRKLAAKLMQRLGLIFLRARVASWRYQRGSRSLLDNLGSGASAAQQENTADDDDDDYDIPEEIEEVLEYLLTALKDKDTVVRWSAAKGIGRVTGRLPKELANDVVGSIMELFTIRETDAAWHGACLSLAELGRRGLLLPQRLPDVVPVIIKALQFDEKRGNFSVGAHVRDAACYVCWAFARAYDPKEIQPHVNHIASALVIVSVFDREVNVRRAAAAAFQENVGRQGQFPHGIDILTTCDYFAVGNRIACYLQLSAYIAQFPEYTRSLIDHLVQIKTNHWDSNMRELCSQALHILCKFDSQYMIESVLPQLVQLCMCMDLNQRHGAILAAAEVTHGLAKLAMADGKSITDIISEKMIDGLRDIVPKLQESRLYRGVGGELMRKASCCLINKLSLAQLPFHGQPVIASWQDLLDDCLQHLEPTIREAAIAAIPAFFSLYYKQKDGQADAQMQEEIIERYLAKLKDSIETTRMGFALALGVLPKLMLTGRLKPVISGLIQCSQLGQEQKMAESRRDAVKALTNVCLCVGVQRSGSADNVLCAENTSAVLDAMFAALQDYTLDSRGDVGAWVREASMSGLYDLIKMLNKDEPSLLTPEIYRLLFVQLVQQACEKIDRTRAHAGALFAELLYHEPPLPHIPDVDKLHEVFPKKIIFDINWAVPAHTFPLFSRLLSSPSYAYNVLLGLTVSVGGLTESLVKFSGDSLLIYLRGHSSDEEVIQAFVNTLLKVMQDYSKVDRVTVPVFRMLDLMLSNNCFDILTDQKSSLLVTLYNQCKSEISRTGEVQKILASIDVFCGLLQFSGDTQRRSLVQLSIFLCHRFPIVRKTTANKLYESVVTYDDVAPEENFEEVMTVLSETQWDDPIPDIRPIRNQLCGLLGVNPPVMLATNK